MDPTPVTTPAPDHSVAPAAAARGAGFGLPHRLRAASVHFAISLAIATSVFLAIYFVWFPGALFAGAGGRGLLLLIFFVDVTIGPLLTFIVFVPGKKNLVLDLCVIAALQLGALA